MAGSATLPAWAPLMHDLVVNEPASEQASQERMAAFVAALGGGGHHAGAPAAAVPRVVRLVEALGPYLTSEDDAQRARATTLLAEVVEEVPACASSAGEVAHLAQFFTARLTDWPAVRGALSGCLTLVSRAPAPPAAPAAADMPSEQGQEQQGGPGQAGLPAPEEGDVAELMRVCVGHVFVRALAQPDRALALRLLAAAVARYGHALLDANLDLLEYLISSVDGEKDPRCLLLCFEAVQAVLGLYHRQPEESLCHDRLEECAEELFEVLACYFPVTFNPPPGDPNRISRQDLAAGLQASLAAEPLFAPFLVPLAVEKLGSALRQAKLDSLSLLGACATSYGPSPLAPFTSTLWTAIRSELAAPAAEGLLPADVPAADEIAAAAAACLERCVAAFQRGEGGTASLADAVLADHSMQDMLACIRSPGQDAAGHRRSMQRARAGARAAAALCRAGGAAATKAFHQLLPPLLDAAAVQAGAPDPGAGSSASWQTQCLGWAALVQLLQAAAAAPPVDCSALASALATASSALLQRAVSAAADALAPAAAKEAAAAADRMDIDSCEDDELAARGASLWPLAPADCTCQHAATLQLAALGAVFGCQSLAAALQPAQIETAVGSVLQLLAVPGLSQQQLAAAVAPLAALACGSHSTMLAACALPRLLAAAEEPRSAAAALAALQALGAASASLRGDIVSALDLAIQQQLRAAAAGATHSSAAADLLQQLLKAAAGMVTGAATSSLASSKSDAVGEAGEAEESSGNFLELGQHLLEAASQLPQAATAVDSPAVHSACADLAYHAMRSATAAQQAPLAAAAAALLQQAAQPQALQACIACALLVPLRPAAVVGLHAGSPAPLVERLVRLAGGQQQEGPLAHWAALAAAALLNKWPADAASLASCAAAVLQGQLYPACGLEGEASSDAAGGALLPAPAPAAWACMAAVVRGLAMRGQREADAAISRAIAGLDAAAQQWQAELPSAAAQGVQAAARFLGTVLESDTAGAAGSRPGLGKQSFATVKPLWQQRLYTAAAGQLLPLLQRSLEAGAQCGVGAGSGAPSTATGAPPLLLALGQLLQAAPAAVLQQDRGRLLPWLVRCLAALQHGPLADGELLQALLLLLSDSLMTDAGQRQAESELLPALVPALLGTARFRPSPAVRETALQCLLLLLELPYAALHPYRREVARVLAAAVDDNRRSVRLQAARVRQAWAAS
ncbi:hypothetical protein ABPG77_004688 [Micractinium sp. CCAP 211/92]